MRKLELAVISSLLVLSFWSTSRAQDPNKNFFFPEYGVRVSAPSGWHVRNESRDQFSSVLITKEEIKNPQSIYKTGIIIITNVEAVFGQKFTDPYALHQAINHTGEPSKAMVDPHKLKTSIGEFDAYNCSTFNDLETQSVQAVLITDDISYSLTFESPLKTWKKYKPVMETIVASLTWNTEPKEGDQIVNSIYSNQQ